MATPIKTESTRISDTIRQFRGEAQRRLDHYNYEIDRTFEEYGTIPELLERRRQHWKSQIDKSDVALQMLELRKMVSREDIS